MNRVRKNKKKGFTLVELMIVVVIMVILAAAATPIFKGYVDRAKQASYLANCRTIYVAAQTAIQDYAIGGGTVEVNSTELIDAAFDSGIDTLTNFPNDVQRLAQLPINGDTYTLTIDTGNLTCTQIVYDNGKGVTVTFKPGSANIED